MTSQQSTPPLETQSPAEGNIRKRVCKACDRCRLKKSKCDGASPCGRCKTDNAICVFGERKKAHDKVYPKGYVEMLEQQQAQLVAGLQELYRRALEGEGWPGSPLKASSNGNPLTHDILQRLGALKLDGNTENETFEEDLTVVQQRLLANGAGMMQRQDSSDGSSTGDSSPTFATQGMFSGESLGVAQFPPTPPNYSPYPRSQQAPTQLNVQPAQRPQPHPQPQSQPQCKQEPLRPQPQPPFYHAKQQPPTFGQVFFPPAQALHNNEMNAQNTLQRPPSWSQLSENVLDDSMDLFRGFDQTGLSLENMDYFHRTGAQVPRHAPPSGLNSCLGQPDWNDEEFKAFFNPSPSLLS